MAHFLLRLIDPDSFLMLLGIGICFFGILFPIPWLANPPASRKTLGHLIFWICITLIGIAAWVRYMFF